LQASITQKIDQKLEQQQQKFKQKTDQRKIWQKVIGSFKGLLMILPGFFTGSLDFRVLSTFRGMIKGGIDLSPKAYGKLKAQFNTYKDGKLISRGEHVTASDYSLYLGEDLKRPSGLDSVKGEINDKFTPPSTSILSTINPNPKTPLQIGLADKFNTIVFEEYFTDWINNLEQDERFKSKKKDFQAVRNNYREIGIQDAEEKIIGMIKEALNRPGNTELRFVNMFGVEFYDPDFILLGVPLGSRAKTQNNVILNDYFEGI
jgi:hypothetical protein